MAARVAFVVDRFPMLSETFVAAQAAALVHNGIAVDIFASRLEPTGLAHEAVVDAGLIDRTRFAEHHQLHRLADWLGRPYPLCERLRSRAASASMANAQPYDVILCHFGGNGLRALDAVRKGRLAGPVWTVFHGYDLSLGMDSRNHPYGDLFRRGARFLPISDFWAERLATFGCPRDRIEVHRMGVDCNEIDYAEPAGGETTRFLTVARFVEKKGIEFALRALAREASGRPWTYTLVGDGPLRPELEQLARELGIAERTHFLGARPHAFVRQALRDAEVFLLPSVTAADGDMEGIPVALMEAMAAGLTVVSTYHSGIPELVQHRKTGMLSPERDARALSDNLRRLMDEPALRRSLARAARQIVMRKFNNETLNLRLVSAIAEQAGTAAPPARNAA